MDAQLQVDYETVTGAPFCDSLTGLFNHGFFQICLEREVKRSQRYGSPFALALMDIDSLFLFNKRHGPAQADRMLKKIGTLTMKNIREADLAARYSDDGLAVIVTRSDANSALLLIERIRHAVDKISNGKLTISAGVALFPSDATDRQSLIQKAQEALTQAKIRGKNKVHVFEEKKNPTDVVVPTILVVDDEPLNLELLEALLSSSDYEVVTAKNGEDALSVIRKADVDLVLLDVMMPDMDGYEVCRRLKASEDTRLIPVVMVTGLDDVDAKVRGIEAGADDFLTKPPIEAELLARVKSLTKVKLLNDNLTSIERVLFSLANTVEAKDAYTQGHVERVSNMALGLGRRLGLPAKQIAALRLGGILHDIGKIGVPSYILNKPGPLDAEELEIMKSHPDVGYKIALPLKKKLGPALEIIRHHHEKLDGSGYPDGLKGEEISVGPRIMVVVDIYDALISDRPYRRAMSKEKALGILHQEVKEGKLDEDVVGCLTEILGR